jgi:hypothetical protein
MNNGARKLIKNLIKVNDSELNVFDLSIKYNLELGFHRINSFSILFQPLILFLSAFLSSAFVAVLNIFCGKKSYKFMSIVFYSACDFHNRYLYLDRLLPLNSFSVVYLPPITLQTWIVHWKARKCNVYFNFFTFGDLANFLFFCFSNFRLLLRLKNSLCTYNRLESRHIFKMIFQYTLYNIHVNNNKCIRNYQIGSSTKYIFDYERGNLFPLLVKLNKLGGKTFHFQHGLMQKPNNFYLPSLAKNVICCSLRERHIYIDSGFDRNNIFVLGSPIQTFHFDDDNLLLQPLKKYDLLVIMGSTEVSIYESFQRDCLKMIGDNLKDLNILCRLRPASRSLDRLAMISELQAFTVSENSSLDYDILSAKVVASFSFDAAFVSFRIGKPTCLVAPSIEIDGRLKEVCIDNPLELIYTIQKILSKGDNLQINNNIKLLLGEYDFEVYKSRFASLLLND